MNRTDCYSCNDTHVIDEPKCVHTASCICEAVVIPRDAECMGCGDRRDKHRYAAGGDKRHLDGTSCDGFEHDGTVACMDCGGDVRWHPIVLNSGKCGVETFLEKYQITPPSETGETPMKTYPLPNGKNYVARNLSGYDDDVTGIRELADQGVHTLLLGDPGTGKTALFQAAFPDSENEIGHSKLTAWDMLWRPRPLEDGSIVFDPSPLTRAATEGKPFYFDEIMRCSEDALTPLYSAMDGRGFIVGGNLDGTDLPVKEGFVVIAASNPLVRGAFLPDAIASRFHIIDVTVTEKLLEQLDLDERLMVLWRNLKARDGGDTWRPSIREMLAAQRFIDAGNMTQAAGAVTGYRVPARDREIVAKTVGPLFGCRTETLGATIG